MHIHFLEQKASNYIVALAEIKAEDIGNLLILKKDYPQATFFKKEQKLEHIATRQLIYHCCTQLGIPRQKFVKDKYGKPHFENGLYHLSISHSYPLVAGMIHKKLPCGIDIESLRPQLLKIKSKFLNESELDYCQDNLEKLIVYWTAKEVLYKIYGRKKVRFAEELAVTISDDLILTGAINKSDYYSEHQLVYQKYNEHYIAYNIS